jgi:hypothetical protein
MAAPAGTLMGITEPSRMLAMEAAAAASYTNSSSSSSSSLARRHMPWSATAAVTVHITFTFSSSSSRGTRLPLGAVSVIPLRIGVLVEPLGVWGDLGHTPYQQPAVRLRRWCNYAHACSIRLFGRQRCFKQCMTRLSQLTCCCCAVLCCAVLCCAVLCCRPLQPCLTTSWLQEPLVLRQLLVVLMAVVAQPRGLLRMRGARRFGGSGRLCWRQLHAARTHDSSHRC